MQGFVRGACVVHNGGPSGGVWSGGRTTKQKTTGGTREACLGGRWKAKNQNWCRGARSRRPVGERPKILMFFVFSFFLCCRFLPSSWGLLVDPRLSPKDLDHPTCRISHNWVSSCAKPGDFLECQRIQRFPRFVKILKILMSVTKMMYLI